MQLSSQEIENRLLLGERLDWEDPKTAQTRAIHLTLARQRRLLKTLLISPIRSAKELSLPFVQALKDASAAGDDPGASSTPTVSFHPAPQNTWLLHKVEAYGFGGLHARRQF